MMKIRTLIYSFREGFKGIHRNRMFSLASVGTIAACLFIFGLFFFVISNFSNMMRSAETGVGVTVFFDEGLTEEEKKEIGNKILARTEVKDAVYISADEAWERYKQTSLKPELIETFGEDNPLEGSDSYTVYVKKIEKQAELVSYIETLEGVRKVNSNGNTASGFSAINSLIGIISMTIITLLLAVAVFLISTTIAMGISVRKEEIFIMRMVGATDFFISAPFIIEGVVIGIIGAVLPLGLLYFIYNSAVKVLSERFNTLVNILVFIDIRDEFRVLVPVSLVIGIGIGFVGSFFTVRRHIDV
ncbi:MAG: permease-like cell division protein FtsX [Catonella sp.]|uniref:permease-like cell division protein FtsX n=1 Tax=Catonella sp. TaxID=2382125 RepID=UPI003F9F5CEC